MLRAASAGRGPTDHLVGRGRSFHGGAVGTRFSLTRRGLLDRQGNITAAGVDRLRELDLWALRARVAGLGADDLRALRECVEYALPRFRDAYTDHILEEGEEARLRARHGRAERLQAILFPPNAPVT